MSACGEEGFQGSCDAILLVWDKDSLMVGLVRGAGGGNLLVFKLQLWETLVDSV